MARATNYWLFKTEPNDFSIQDLAKSPQKTTFWDGVRNYQARNFLRDSIKLGDRVLLYHSNSDPSSIVGVAQVVKEGYPDPTALDPNDSHYDPKSTADNPRWYMVDVQLEQIFTRPLPLAELREVKALAAMELLRKGSRLSVQPVSSAEFKTIMKLSG
jgi:predicted RNA-binding protein with PUA-like domain